MSTRDYVHTLVSLKSGDLSLLRTHANQGIDRSAEAFDLFAGIWWPLRSKSQRAPRREVAWLIAKLYAYRPLTQNECVFARQLASCEPRTGPERERFRKRYDRLLMQPLAGLEQPLCWALDELAAGSKNLNWVKLIDDLSIWEREDTRLKWAQDFLGATETRRDD